MSTIISDSLNDQNTQPPAWSNRGHHKHTQGHQRGPILQSQFLGYNFLLFHDKVFQTEKYKIGEETKKTCQRDKQRHLAVLD